MLNEVSRPPCVSSTETDALSLLSVKTTLGFLSYEVEQKWIEVPDTKEDTKYFGTYLRLDLTRPFRETVVIT